MKVYFFGIFISKLDLMYRFLVFMIFVFNFNFSFSYLEYKYWCKVSKDKIVISLNKENEKFVKCIDYIKNINIKLKKIENNINLANKYLKSKYNNDWQQILTDNLNKKKLLEKFKKELLNKIDIFEGKLFKKVKLIIFKKFDNYKKSLLKERTSLYKTYIFYLSNGDIKSLKYIRKKLEKNYYYIMLVDFVLNSKDFSELIPALRLFFKLKKGV